MGYDARLGIWLVKQANPFVAAHAGAAPQMVQQQPPPRMMQNQPPPGIPRMYQNQPEPSPAKLEMSPPSLKGPTPLEMLREEVNAPFGNSPGWSTNPSMPAAPAMNQTMPGTLPGTMPGTMANTAMNTVPNAAPAAGAAPQMVQNQPPPALPPLTPMGGEPSGLRPTPIIPRPDGPPMGMAPKAPSGPVESPAAMPQVLKPSNKGPFPPVGARPSGMPAGAKPMMNYGPPRVDRAAPQQTLGLMDRYNRLGFGGKFGVGAGAAAVSLLLHRLMTGRMAGQER